MEKGHVERQRDPKWKLEERERNLFSESPAPLALQQGIFKRFQTDFETVVIFRF